MFHYLDEVDTLDDVDIDDDVDTELEVETLKQRKSICIIEETEMRVFLISCKNNNSRKSLISTSTLNEHNSRS